MTRKNKKNNEPSVANNSNKSGGGGVNNYSSNNNNYKGSSNNNNNNNYNNANTKNSRKYMNNNESSKYNNNWNSIKDSRIISSAEENEKLARRTQRFNNSKKEPKGMSDVDMFLIAIVCTWDVSKFVENNSTKTTLDPSNNDNTTTETTNNNIKRMKAYDFFIDREPPVCYSELYSINEDQLCEELEERLNIVKI